MKKMLAKLANRKAENYVDSGIKIVIAIVIGALLLMLLYGLFKEVIMPNAENKVNSFFDGTPDVNITLD